MRHGLAVMTTVATILGATSVCAESMSGGLAFGFGHSNVKHKMGPNKSGIATHETHQDLSMNGFLGGLFANWRTQMSEGELPTHAGIELAADLSTQKGKATSFIVQGGQRGPAVNIKRKNAFQLVGLLGAKYGNMRTDIRVGYDFSNMEYKTNGSGTPSKKRQYVGGLSVGFGLAAEVTPTMTLGLTYDYILHSSFKANNMSIGGLAGLAAPAADVKLRARTGVVKLRFGYAF
ncbi:outer membrane beta-barrel protein [Alphaproteobacteria bacterium]|nr:outer membrane beta-barrel protein [Alphaproteobacteria bacterium]